MPKQKLKIILSMAAIVGAAAILFFHLFERPPKIEPRPHLALGEVLAEQVAKTVGGGGRITVIAPDTTLFSHPGAELQLKAFHRALRKLNLHVTATNLLKLDPIRLMRVPRDFTRLLSKQSEADVIVSLLGPIMPTAEEKARLPQKRARVIAVCSGDMPRQVNLKTLLDEHLLDVAIISRATPPLALPQSDHLPDWFAHFFQVVTVKNSSDLPVLVNGGAR